jgi:hypothetical protein
VSHDGDWCRAVSQRGAPVTVYAAGRAALKTARRDGDFICTQDPGHERSHAACDGQGHILARWPRKDAERHWQPGDCAGHDHGGAAREALT